VDRQPSRTTLGVPTPAIPEPIESVGFNESLVVFVTLDVNMIQRRPNSRPRGAWSPRGVDRIGFIRFLGPK
jgi:hypothetical protein